ncbi:secreted RxLR effector protein 161-like [Henckelia pumila]|uniref:secreted RxLR effector protein 161-like n=1 Tax=Henckelia pumila TaxID=405737 RepID=UPI003C6EA2F0
MEHIPYASGVGSIMYAMVCTRPDLAYAISVISRFMSNQGIEHWKALKWILKYIKRVSDLGLVFKEKNESTNPIVGYVDSDFAGNLDTRKSLTGFVFTAYGTAVTWKSSLQYVVAFSTTEVKFIAVTEAMKEAIWLRGFAAQHGIIQGQVEIHCDNQSAIHLAKHQVFHERSKHIDVNLYFVRDVTAQGTIVLKKIATEDNPADLLTKSLPLSKIKHCLNLVSVSEWSG